MRRQMMGKALIAVFGGSMALCGPSVPALATTAGNCYEVILFCKYHSQYYASFQECLDDNRDTMCPPSATAVSGDGVVAGLNAQVKDRL